MVTGGSGFLGKKLLERLIKEGHQVKALARSQRSAQTVSALGATAVSGSLENIEDCANSLKKMDILIQCGGVNLFSII